MLYPGWITTTLTLSYSCALSVSLTSLETEIKLCGLTSSYAMKLDQQQLGPVTTCSISDVLFSVKLKRILYTVLILKWLKKTANGKRTFTDFQSGWWRIPQCAKLKCIGALLQINIRNWDEQVHHFSVSVHLSKLSVKGYPVNTRNRKCLNCLKFFVLILGL